MLGGAESSEALVKVLPIGVEALRSWHGDPRPVEFLQSVQQHWPVFLLQNVLSNVNRIVRGHTHNLRVVGTVVDLAEGEPIRHFGPAALVPIWKDVSGV